MSNEQGADDLRRENEELREQLRQRTRAGAAEKAGLDPKAAKWIKGDTPEEAEADAFALARELGSKPAPRSETGSAAQALADDPDRLELARALSGNAETTDDEERS